FPHPALPARGRALAVGGVVQYRDHRRDGQPRGRVRGRAPGVGGGVPGCGVPGALHEGAGELLAPHRHPALPPRGSLRQARHMRGGGIAALLAVAMLAALPAVLSSYAVTVFIFFFAYLGQAWNIVGGYAGQLSAGHAAFVGVGAYTSAMLSMTLGLTPWIGMFIGGALSACLGAVIGYLGFRFGLRGFY